MKAHKIRIITAIVVILLGLTSISLGFTPYANPPQCEGTQHPDLGDRCIIGANIAAGLFAFLGLAIVGLGVVGLLASFAYRAKQLHQHTKARWLLAMTLLVFVLTFIGILK